MTGRHIDPRAVATATARTFGYLPSDLRNPGRHAGRQRARRIALHVALEMTSPSRAALARAFGRMSPGSVRRDVEAVAERVRRHGWWRTVVADIRTQVAQVGRTGAVLALLLLVVIGCGSDGGERTEPSALATDGAVDGAAQCAAEGADCAEAGCCVPLLCSHGQEGAFCRSPCTSDADCVSGCCVPFFDRPELTVCSPVEPCR